MMESAGSFSFRVNGSSGDSSSQAMFAAVVSQQAMQTTFLTQRTASGKGSYEASVIL